MGVPPATQEKDTFIEMECRDEGGMVDICKEGSMEEEGESCSVSRTIGSIAHMGERNHEIDDNAMSTYGDTHDKGEGENSPVLCITKEYRPHERGKL